MSESTSLVTAEQVQTAILVCRGQRVLLDSTLAALYGVTTGALNRAVKRNMARFPDDFMFQLSAAEVAALKSQSVISKGRGGVRKPPFVFTEQGVAMLSSVLNSERAVLVNIEIMRVFVRLRQALATHEELARRLEAVEREVGDHGRLLEDVVEAIRAIIDRPPPPSRRIGFRDETPMP
jgi:hypothetical protein